MVKLVKQLVDKSNSGALTKIKMCALSKGTFAAPFETQAKTVIDALSIHF